MFILKVRSKIKTRKNLESWTFRSSRGAQLQHTPGAMYSFSDSDDEDGLVAMMQPAMQPSVRAALARVAPPASSAGQLDPLSVTAREVAQTSHMARGAPLSSARIWALSDIHTDYRKNREWCASICSNSSFSGDTLLLAGDVSSSLEILRETLTALRAAFRAVFFVPGNHDLWLTPCDDTAAVPTSLAKLNAIRAMCDAIGVQTRPALSAGCIVAPLLSWYHESWDTDESVGSYWGGIPRIEKAMVDFYACRWPAPLVNGSEALAQRIDSLNTDVDAAVVRLRALHPDAPLITMSHFLPRIELCPEKRFLLLPTLAKAVGSRFLRQRVARLRPAMHLFGHTHFGWDATLDDGVRYVQAALSYPRERDVRLATVATGACFPADAAPAPLLLRDAAAADGCGAFVPRYDCAWSNFYARYERRADLTHSVPEYVAKRYTRLEGGAVGWGEGIDPVWAFGPLPTTREGAVVAP